MEEIYNVKGTQQGSVILGKIYFHYIRIGFYMNIYSISIFAKHAYMHTLLTIVNIPQACYTYHFTMHTNKSRYFRFKQLFIRL